MYEEKQRFFSARTTTFLFNLVMQKLTNFLKIISLVEGNDINSLRFTQNFACYF